METIEHTVSRDSLDDDGNRAHTGSSVTDGYRVVRDDRDVSIKRWSSPTECRRSAMLKEHDVSSDGLTASARRLYQVGRRMIPVFRQS